MIDSTANKYKESSKDSWMTSQTKPVSSSQNIIENKKTINSKLVQGFSQDSVMKSAYQGYIGGNKDVIKDSANHKESSHGESA